ncbi:MAG: glycosyltransferase family 39 protein [Candidatus Solibacter usitatus]|nr:glycosyltransferase family 39 protein [Candidatus Solibacter usitatus]
MTIAPLLGIQLDEAIFTGPMFKDGWSFFAVPLAETEIPIMIMSYLGAAKTWLYVPIFFIWDPSVYSLRIPPILLGVISILASYSLLTRIAGRRVALFGTALLATDPSYMMATTMDWGPVAIQHVCLIAALAFFVRAYQASQTRFLAAGAFLLGLGCWDKALFLWMLSGCALASVCLLPQIKRFISLWRITVLGLFFLLGASPLVFYNYSKPLETFRANTSFSTDDLAQKVHVLRGTVDGSAFFRFLVEEDSPNSPNTVPPRLLGEHHRNLNWYALITALCLAPFLLFTTYRRAVLFCVITMSVAWVQMLITRGAGAGSHHTLLLWPFPLILIAIAASAASDRLGRAALPFLISVCALLCASNLLVSRTYWEKAARNGGPGPWTNAIFSLAKRLPAYDVEHIFLTDWGLYDNTRLLTKGELPLRIATGPLMRPDPTPEERAEAGVILGFPNAIFVSNTDDRQNFPQVNAHLRTLSAAFGYRREVLELVPDSRGRPCIEISRYVK